MVDAKQAGAAGILGLITAVTAQGTPILSSFACSLGMDAPVEACPVFHVLCHLHSEPAPHCMQGLLGQGARQCIWGLRGL